VSVWFAAWGGIDTCILPVSDRLDEEVLLLLLAIWSIVGTPVGACLVHVVSLSSGTG